jgi:hypothetical protein
MTLENVSPKSFHLFKHAMTTDHQAVVTTPLTPGGDGQIISNGVTAPYVYDEQARTLKIDLTHRPFYLPIETIEQSLTEIMTAIIPPEDIPEPPVEPPV